MPSPESNPVDAPRPAPTRPREILIVEDEALFAKAVGKRLQRAGYECRIAGKLGEARKMFADGSADLILLDMRLPDGSGLDFLETLRHEHGSDVPVLVMTAYGELEDAVAAMKLAASDYLKKPIDLDELLLNVEKVLAKEEVVMQLAYSRKRESSLGGDVALLGEAAEIRDIRAQAERIGKLCSNADLIPPTVLILGETGTGKDLAARLLHGKSARSDRPFVHVDCAALPKDLIEAELFGHVKGAFTSAHGERTGLIEAAEDGTLFLDEIAELPLDLQTKLLAVLERRTLRRVGSSRERPVAAWIIAATNRDVQAMVQEGRLRSDLYFRLNVLSLEMPPLRKRGEDIMLLAEYFAKKTAERYGVGPVEMDAKLREALLAYEWPGNVRELKHLMERAVLLSQGGTLKADALMLEADSHAEQDRPEPELSDLTLEQAERAMLEQALRRNSHNVSAAARQLGITRMAMRYRMKKYGLN